MTANRFWKLAHYRDRVLMDFIFPCVASQMGCTGMAKSYNMYLEYGIDPQEGTKQLR